MSAIRVAASRRAALVAVTVVASLVATGVPDGAAAEEEIRIIRDEFGVPHIFAATDARVSYGAGYALAQDRLWQMIVFKHIAKGRLSDILGPIVVDIDKEVRFYTYTEEERAARFETLPKDIRQNLQAFADGINARLAEVRTNPSLVPFEFTQLNEEDELVEDWTVDDSVALSDVLILAFGSGGGNELAYAELLAELTEKLGKKPGKKAFNDLIMRVDPDSPVSIPRNFDYKHSSTFARVGDANKRRGLTADARLGLEAGQEQRADRAPRAATGTMQQLGLIPDIDAALEGYDALERGRRLLRRVFTFGSNAQIAGPALSEDGNTTQTGGPQVGYLLPQWLADFGLHGDKLNATGMTFAGAGPAVLIGRGNGFAWTTTTGASDLTDTYVEELNPDDPNQYMYKGKFEDMDCRTETHTFRGAPFEEQEICRTRHGPVLSVDEANNVAYSVRYAWFNREGQTVEGFFRYNEVESVEDFATFANFLSSNHNMFYTDDQGNFGYWHPGNHVKRAKGIDIRLPQDGTGGSEWRGLLPIKKVPHAVNFERGWLANWNNQPAKNWRRERGHPALDNVLDLEDALNPGGKTLQDPFGAEDLNPDGMLDFDDANGNLRYAAFKHHRHTYFAEYLPTPDTLEGDMHKQAAEVARSWNGFLNDTDEDGMVDSAGKSIIDRWVQHMQTLAFEDDLGELTCWEEGACATNESLLWHLLNTNDRAKLGYDWLGELSAEELAAQAFVSAVDELAAENENEDPATWKEEVALEHYQRLNADLATDTAETEMGNGQDDSGRPGDVADHIAMDRGTYNHIVAYLTPPSGQGLGNADSKSGSVIPPGQSGFINQLGEEDPHYESQLHSYIDWTYKPMPMTLEEVLAVATSDETITRPAD